MDDQIKRLDLVLWRETKQGPPMVGRAMTVNPNWVLVEVRGPGVPAWIWRKDLRKLRPLEALAAQA